MGVILYFRICWCLTSLVLNGFLFGLFILIGIHVLEILHVFSIIIVYGLPFFSSF